MSAANHANAQLSTGPTSEAGKAKSSSNAVKTGLRGRNLLFADAEEAGAYREHVGRLFEHWVPVGVAEHTLVQALANTYWHTESIPGLESSTYTRGRRCLLCRTLRGQTGPYRTPRAARCPY